MMRIPEAARILGVADADLRSVESHKHGVKVTAWTGACWLIHNDGRLFALDYHPGTKNLALWNDDDKEKRAPVFDDKPEPPRRDHDKHDESDEPGVRDLAVDIPEGNVGEIMDWVGDDKERAQRALDKENERSTPRRGLVNHLKKITEG